MMINQTQIVKIAPGPEPSPGEIEQAAKAVAETQKRLTDIEGAIAKAISAENTELLIRNEAEKKIQSHKLERQKASLHDLQVFKILGKMAAAGKLYREAKAAQHAGQQDLRSYLEGRLEKAAAKKLSQDPVFWPSELRGWRQTRSQAVVDYADLSRELKKVDPQGKYQLPPC